VDPPLSSTNGAHSLIYSLNEALLISNPVDLTLLAFLSFCPAIKAVASPDPVVELPLTAENVESVLDEVRPYLMADGGNVALHEIDGNIIRLKLQGACGSCPSSVTTVKLGIERRLMEKIPEIVAVEPVSDEETGLELNAENIEKVR
jgi:Fe-S cluster biogenesis protein NfuA